MTTEECYIRVGGDWVGVLGRLGGEARVSRFLRMVPNDPSFRDLAQAMERGDRETAFRGAHSLKGLALNLGLTPLADGASALTECLRGDGAGGDALFQALQTTYDATLAAIRDWETEEGGQHG